MELEEILVGDTRRFIFILGNLRQMIKVEDSNKMSDISKLPSFLKELIEKQKRKFNLKLTSSGFLNRLKVPSIISVIKSFMKI